MKKVCLIILFVLLLPATSSFAAPLTETGQEIFIPYAQVGSGYWAGIAIHNTSSGSMIFSIGVYKCDGTWVAGSTFSVPAHAMIVDLLEGFFGGMAPSLRMSVRIRTTANVPFQTTLFVGTDHGFGFQNYKSEEYTYPVMMLP